MKIAIVCDWLVTYAGAERVLEELLICFPDADVFAVVDFLEPKDRHFLQNKSVKTTFIQKLPFAKKHYRAYLNWMPLAIEQLDVSAYDLVISSSHAVAKGVMTGPDQVHISYVHSPMRYAWDLQHQYLRESGLDKGLKGYFAQRLLHKMRIWDQRTANGVDYFIGNSRYIARRIFKTYRRKADVIYPPVQTSLFKPGNKKDDFYLTASRMVPYKKMDLIVESFANMPDKKLVVIGDGPEMAKIKAKAGKNTQILGVQSSDILIDYMQRAKAFVFAAEEDFGITPVEAQACGTPVIAYGKGGVLETIRDINQPLPTGLFFAKQEVSYVCEAVKRFEAAHERFTVENCVANASQFSAKIFRKQMKQYVAEKMGLVVEEKVEIS
ncbi:MAG TPA: glycosyltransferase family 4 protein [Gammaproteobacteria bacterium]|nr:glycosyltransferase family 4 protein [Gammaproteobacteria bacterium]